MTNAGQSDPLHLLNVYYYAFNLIRSRILFR